MTTATSIFLIGMVFVALLTGIAGYVFKKYMVLFILSGLLWCILGIMFLMTALPEEIPIGYLSLTCFAFGMAMLLSPVFVREKPVPVEPVARLRPSDRLERRLEKMNKASNRFKNNTL